jgi:hypothetical protein
MLRKLILAGIFAAAVALAQGGGMEGMGGMGGGGGSRRGGGMDGMQGMGGMQRQQRQSRADQLADKLKLNKEQKEQMLQILSAAREKAAPIRQEIDKQRAQIAGAMIDGKTGDDLQKLLANYSTVEAQMAGVEAEAFGKIYAILKPNQQGKAAPAFDLMAAAFDAPARGGQGRGRGEAR